MAQNLTAAERQEQILSEGLRQAAALGYQNVSIAGVARVCGCMPGLVFHYFDTLAGFRRELMRRAVKQECLAVIAQGIALRDPVARRAPAELRARALAKLQR